MKSWAGRGAQIVKLIFQLYDLVCFCYKSWLGAGKADRKVDFADIRFL